MTILPDHGRGVRVQVELVLDGATFGRRMVRTIVDKEQIAVWQHVGMVLNSESVEWIANERELVMASPEPPDDLPCRRVDLGDLAEISEGDDVVPVGVAHH